MKKIISVCLLSAFLFSCSNDPFNDDSFNLNLQNESSLNTNLDSVAVVSSFEDLSKIFNTESKDDSTSNINLRAGFDLWTGFPPGWKWRPNGIYGPENPETAVTGYDSMTKGNTQRVTFTSEMARILGLYTGRIYRTHLRIVTKKITIPNGYIFFEDNSPNCGYTPTSQGTLFNTRNYSAGSGSSPITLTTHTYFVEADEWAGNINKEYPCPASQLEWRYILWKE